MHAPLGSLLNIKICHCEEPLDAAGVEHQPLGLMSFTQSEMKCVGLSEAKTGKQVKLRIGTAAAVGVRPEGHRQYRFATAPNAVSVSCFFFPFDKRRGSPQPFFLFPNSEPIAFSFSDSICFFQKSCGN